MRIAALELRRFGHFEDGRLDLGDGTGVHVVYGPNEAGKSTTLDAIRYTLFGMPVGRSADPKYDFKHRTGQIRTAVRLHLDDGTELSFARSRAKDASVLDFVTDKADPAAADRLAGVLAGVPKELWQAKYGLNQAGLRAGAQALLDGAATGEALYAVATGMGGARRVLDQLSADRRALLADSGRAGLIHDSVQTLKESTRAFNAARRATARYDDVVAELARLAASVEELRERELRLGNERDTLARAVDAAPLLAERCVLVDQRDAITGAPVAWGPDEHERFASVTSDIDRLDSEIVRLQQRIRQLDERRSSLVADEGLLAVADRLDGLHQRLAEVATSAAELPRLRAEARTAADDLRRAVGAFAPDEIDTPDPESLVPSAAARAQLARALQTAEELDLEQAGAVRELELSRQRLDAARRALPADSEGDEAELQQLDAALTLAARIDEAEIAALAGQVESAMRALDMRSARIPGAVEDLAAVLTLELPTASVLSELERRWEDLAVARSETRRRHEQATAKLQEHHAALASLEGGTAVPDPERLGELRRERDGVWEDIRDVALGASSITEVPAAISGYESALQATDSYADELVADAARVGSANELRRLIAADERRCEVASTQLIELDVSESRLAAEWATAWAPSGLTVAAPESMRETVAQIEAIRAEHDRRRADVDQLLARRDRLELARQDLARCLHGMPDEVPSLAALLELAQVRKAVLVQRRASSQTASGELKATKTDHEERSRALQRVLDRRETCAAEWQEALSAMRLPSSTSAVGARGHLEALVELVNCMCESGEAQQRLAACEDIVATFAADVRSLVQSLGGRAAEFAGGDPQVVVTRLRAVVADATANRRLLDELEDQLREHRDALDRATAAHGGQVRALEALVASAHVDDAAALAAADRCWTQRAQLQQRLAELEQKLVSEARMPVSQVIELIGDRDVVALRLAVERLDAEVAEVVERRRAATSERDEANQAAGAIRGSAAQAQAGIEMRDAHAQLARLVPEYRQLALQERMLASILDDRARRDMGPIVERTGEYLGRLTRGAWRGMIVGIDDGGAPQVQLERGSDGEHVALHGLSEGTADQLYLALRLATLVEGAGRGESMPLIVDDVLPSFDDERAAATLQLLADVAQHMQVIFLTHHEHLVQLATQVVDAGQLNVHRLERFGREAVVVKAVAPGGAAPAAPAASAA